MLAVVIMWIIGIIFVITGYLIWKKQKISFLHSYHYDEVSEDDKKAFCTTSGIGIILIGIGVLISGVFIGVIDTSWSVLPFAIGFGAGMGMLIYAGRKYNH